MISMGQEQIEIETLTRDDMKAIITQQHRRIVQLESAINTIRSGSVFRSMAENINDLRRILKLPLLEVNGVPRTNRKAARHG